MKPDNTNKSGVFTQGSTPAPTAPVSGALGKRRYSNYETENGGGFDWNEALSSVSSLLGNIFGKGDRYQVQALQTINEEQRKTTTILWIVIGLMAALGMVILIRKSK